jgi:RNA polymerase subunit RPABC4/transcription elongation factor Spt4
MKCPYCDADERPERDGTCRECGQLIDEQRMKRNSTQFDTASEWGSRR